MITWSHDEAYSVQIFFCGFIISSAVIIDLENHQNLTNIIILTRIFHVIHQFKIAATPTFETKVPRRVSVAWSPVNLRGL